MPRMLQALLCISYELCSNCWGPRRNGVCTLGTHCTVYIDSKDKIESIK